MKCRDCENRPEYNENLKKEQSTYILNTNICMYIYLEYEDVEFRTRKMIIWRRVGCKTRWKRVLNIYINVCVCNITVQWEVFVCQDDDELSQLALLGSPYLFNFSRGNVQSPSAYIICIKMHICLQSLIF